MRVMSIGLLVASAIMVGYVAAAAQNVLVNQAGYLPDRKKLAYICDGSDSFYVENVKTGQIDFSGKLVLKSPHDPSTGLTTFLADFSRLTTEGVYRIRTSRSDTSYRFEIGTNVFEDAFRKSLKGFYFQRCGTGLDREHAGEYARSTCHLKDAELHPSTGKSGFLETTGGWHDAGDYGKYVVNAGVSVGTLLLAYELFPDRFSRDDLNIPESGNSVPDILDESRYELDWLLKMQDPSDGGVYFKLTTEKFDPFEMPDRDISTRYIYEKSTTATGDFVAVMARAARVYAAFDSRFAARCLSAAEKGWEYLQANPSVVPPGGFRNPKGTLTGSYGDPIDSDERLWAASELFVTTGDDRYDSYFRSHVDVARLFRSVLSWGYVAPMAGIAYFANSRQSADTSLAVRLKTALLEYCSGLAGVSSTDGLSVALTDSDYHWGSNGTDMNKALLLIVGYRLSGKIDFYNAALDQLNYILGCNVKDISYLTGVGTVSPMHIHHRPSGADGIVAPVPGLLAGGPDHDLTDAVLRASYNESTRPAACYEDAEGSYASNEIAINWNAPLVFVAGFFNESSPRPPRAIEH